MLNVTHIISVLVSLTRLVPDTSRTFSKIPDISLTAVKFPDISRFSRQVVTLKIRSTHKQVDYIKYAGDSRLSTEDEERTRLLSRPNIGWT